MRKIYSDTKACLFIAYNGKFGGGRIQLSPMSLINDGFFEVMYYGKRFSLLKAAKLFEQAKTGSEFVYDPDVEIRRVQRLKVTNKNKEVQDINIDGEDLKFKKYAKY